jgi:membrane protein
MTVRTFLRRLWAGLLADNVDDLGAMLAFYAVLALFPMLVFVVTITVLALPADAITQGVAMVAPAMPRSSYQLIGDQVVRMQQTSVTSGFLIGGAALALWGASRGTSALILALDQMMSLEETRSWLKRQGIAIAVTLGGALLAVAAMALLFFGPTAGHWAADRWGLGAWFDLVWTIGRWVGAGVLALGVFVVLFRVLPNWRATTRDVLPGAAVAMLLWLGVSKLFGLYVDLAGSFDKTYGTLAGVIVFLIWLWLSAMALLVGAEVNQVLVERRKGKLAVGRLVGLDRAERVEEQMKLAGSDLGR